MRPTPIEDLRQRMHDTARRRGTLSPSTQRISRVLDRLLLEWYQTAPDQVLAASVLMPAAMEPSDLQARFEEAKAKNDSATLAGLLPAVLALPRDNPERPQMLNCCGFHAAYQPNVRIPELALAALAEAAATAPVGSQLALKANGNLAAAYQRAGRIYAAYFLYRQILGPTQTLAGDGPVEAAVYYGFASVTRWLGKERLTRTSLEKSFRIAERLGLPRQIALVKAARYSNNIPYLSLANARQQLRTEYPNSPCQAHLLGSYAGVLLLQGRPRAAIAVATRALARVCKEHPVDILTQMELHIMLAAACHRVGNEAGSKTFLDRARQLLGPADLARPATVRMQDWLAITARP